MSRNIKIGLAVVGVALLAFVGSRFMPEGSFFATLFERPPVVTLQTSEGDIVIELFSEEAPELSNNFYWIAKSGRYDDTIFHRVIDGFMIQGGDYENGDGTGGEGFRSPYLEDEFSPELSHVRGMVSMANKGPDTNGSQFFIVQQDVPYLDGRHSIFGKVTEGMDVVDQIARAAADGRDRPLRDIKIREVRISD